MIDNPRAIGAVYEAGMHCIACAEARFGQSLYDVACAIDRTGEAVLLMYSFNECGSGPCGTWCDTCGEECVLSPWEEASDADLRAHGTDRATFEEGCQRASVAAPDTLPRAAPTFSRVSSPWPLEAGANGNADPRPDPLAPARSSADATAREHGERIAARRRANCPW